MLLSRIGRRLCKPSLFLSRCLLPRPLRLHRLASGITADQQECITRRPDFARKDGGSYSSEGVQRAWWKFLTRRCVGGRDEGLLESAMMGVYLCRKKPGEFLAQVFRVRTRPAEFSAMEGLARKATTEPLQMKLVAPDCRMRANGLMTTSPQRP